MKTLKEFLIPLIILGCILLYLFAQSMHWPTAAIVIAVASIALGSYRLFQETIQALLKKQFGLDYIAILAIIVSVFTGEYLAGAMIALMIATGRTLEDYGSRRAQRSLTKLIDRLPQTVTVVDEQQTSTTTPVANLKIGQHILVRKGEVIAIDGELDSTLAVIDESSLTGEPYFLDKNQGDTVRSGTINIGDPFTMTVTHLAKDSTYEKIIQLVKSAAAEKPPLVRLADRYSTIFTVVTLSIAAITYIVSQDPLRVLAVLVVATPCPLILATPIALLGGVNALAKRNIIVKKLASIEVLNRLDALLFDKTGTITLGKPSVTGVELHTTELTASEALGIAAAIERHSLHPLAKAVVAYARAQSAPHYLSKDVTEKIGIGIVGTVNNASYTLKKRTGGGLAIALYQTIDQVEHSVATISFHDEIKTGSQKVLAEFKAKGLILMMLTGDKKTEADAVAATLGNFMEVHADCTPEDKQRQIAQLKAKGKTVAMVGDGINDAPALALADVGIVFSSEQQTASSEAADIVILNSEFELTVTLVQVAQRTIRIAKQSIIWGIGLSVIAMIAAAFGWIPPVTGAVLQEGIDLAVILNALRASR